MGQTRTAEKETQLEVPVLQTGYGSMRKYHFSCPHCQKSIVIGPSGNEGACEHKFNLLARRFDDLVAVFA